MGHRKNEAITQLRKDRPRRKKIQPVPLQAEPLEGEQPRVENTKETEYYDSESGESYSSQSEAAFSGASREIISNRSGEEEKSSEVVQSDKSSIFGDS